jgi:tetratricopeptide (TPR) repeat protein
MLGGQQYPFSKAQGSSVREQICAQIVADLRLKLTPEDRLRLSQGETNNPDAAIEYQKGRDCWYKRDVQNIKNSISYYGRSLNMDPSYAKAHAGLADSYAVLAGSEDPRENASKARLEAEKALSLDNRLAEAYTSLAIVAFKFDWDWPNVETKLSKAIQLKSNSADAHYWYAAYLSVMGRRDESIAESRRAAELDPLNATYRLNVARLLYVARRSDNAIVECKEAIRLNPNSGVAYVYLGYLYRDKGQYDQALAEFQHALTLTSDQWYIKSAIGTIYALTGRKQEAKKILEELIPKARPIYVAQLQIALGEKDEAFASLEQAYLERADSLGFLNVDPSYDPIRSDPRFSDLVHRVGLPTSESPK